MDYPIAARHIPRLGPGLRGSVRPIAGERCRLDRQAAHDPGQPVVPHQASADSAGTSGPLQCRVHREGDVVGLQ